MQNCCIFFLVSAQPPLLFGLLDTETYRRMTSFGACDVEDTRVEILTGVESNHIMALRLTVSWQSLLIFSSKLPVCFFIGLW